MKRKNRVIMYFEQDLTYIIVLLMAIMTDYHIVPNYFKSNIWRIDSFFLALQGFVFIFECLQYLKRRNNADIKEDIEIMDKLLNDTYESGQGKLLFIIKSILVKGFTIIVVVRMLLHIIGIEII